MTNPQPSSLRVVIAGNVSAELARKNITRQDLAKKLDVDPSWVSRRLNGLRPLNIDEVANIAAVLDVDAEVLLRAKLAKA